MKRKEKQTVVQGLPCQNVEYALHTKTLGDRAFSLLILFFNLLNRKDNKMTSSARKTRGFAFASKHLISARRLDGKNRYKPSNRLSLSNGFTLVERMPRQGFRSLTI